jgi:hypothetical protein
MLAWWTLVGVGVACVAASWIVAWFVEGERPMVMSVRWLTDRERFR